ncbi:MAG: hypothetical protein KAJ78_02500 [Acidobacteria bacterium]|nr:hypothetical protein [Acidobacteriota bacterium]
MSASEIVVKPVREPWPEAILQRVVQALSGASDVAFAYLVDAGVPGQGDMHVALFVWLQPGALRSLGRVLNQVSAIVSGAMPSGKAVDVIILNSAPEMLEVVEAAGGLIVENDPEERRRALEAAAATPTDDYGDHPRKGPWWWPF